MSRELGHLVKAAAEGAKRTLDFCSAEGLEIIIYCTYRDPVEQARIYRQSRTHLEIQKKIEWLNSSGYKFLADLLDGVGPQFGQIGRHVTSAAPGESWHNYGMAFDGVPVIDGKLAWDASRYAEIWERYGKAVEDAGLIWAGRWISIRELPHAQLIMSGNPLNVYKQSEVETMLRNISFYVQR